MFSGNFADGHSGSGIVTATTFHGDGSQLTGIEQQQIETGNTKVETIDTGSNGHVKILKVEKY